MLRFFRQLRKDQLMSDKTRKYLLYAVGEILLVVIGILIALQVNNWNENRVDRNLEQEYYCRFLENSEQDRLLLLDMMTRTRNRLTHANEALRILLSEKPLKLDLGRAEYNASQGLTVLFEPDETAYQDLISGSYLNIITESTVKEAINYYYSSVSGLIEIMRTNNDVYASTYFDDKLLMETGWKQARMKNDRLIEGLEPDLFTKIPVDFYEKIKPENIEDLLNRNLQFVAILSRRLELEQMIMDEIDRFQTELSTFCTL